MIAVKRDREAIARIHSEYDDNDNPLMLAKCDLDVLLDSAQRLIDKLDESAKRMPREVAEAANELEDMVTGIRGHRV